MNSWWIRPTSDSIQQDRPLCRLLKAVTYCLMIHLEAAGTKDENSKRRREIVRKHCKWIKREARRKEGTVWTYKNCTRQPTQVQRELRTKGRNSCSCLERWRLKWGDRGKPLWPSIRSTDRTPTAATQRGETLGVNTNETKPSTDWWQLYSRSAQIAW